jgi:thymidylate synthase (FAD)
MIITIPSVELLHATPNPEREIERAGRICYQSTHKIKPCEACKGEKRRQVEYDDQSGPIYAECRICGGTGTDKQSAIDFVRMIVKRGHESVIEHVYASFLVVCDRGVSHEIVRHRIDSFSQESTRYCNYAKEQFGGEIKVVEPLWKSPDGYARALWMDAMKQAEAAYLNLLKVGEPPELARSVLPTCLKTELTWTANFREWRHIMRLRTSEKAHPQMREIAGMIRRILMQLAPVCFEDIP